MAAPWPSQRRGTSERHSALARMRERRAGRTSPDEEFASRPAPRPLKPKSGVGYDTPRTEPRAAPPWSPAWTPDSPRPKLDDDDPPSPARISMPAPGGPALAPGDGARRPPVTQKRDIVDAAPLSERQFKGRSAADDGESRRSALDDRESRRSAPDDREFRRSAPDDREFQSSGSHSSRVRGPTEARAARGGNRDSDPAEEPLPPGAAKADFKTLQSMIAQGIQDKEKEAESLEGAVIIPDDDEGLQRHREAVKKRRDDEGAARQKARENDRQRRRKEQEQRERKMAEALEMEESEEQRYRASQAAAKTQCRHELAAASRIQAHFRGWKSRAGVPTQSRTVVACLHLEPFMAPK